MLNIKITKKYFIGIVLAIFFNATTFATDITPIAYDINDYLEAVTDLAYVEYKTGTEYSNEDIQELVKSALREILDIDTIERLSVSITSLCNFSKELVNIANNIRSRVKTECHAGIYKNRKPYAEACEKYSNRLPIASLYLSCIFSKILPYSGGILAFTENQELSFIVELTDKNVLESEKKALFDALVAMTKQNTTK